MYLAEGVGGGDDPGKPPGQFEKVPLGWDLNTISFLYKWIVSLPLKVPDFLQRLMETSRLFGVAGSTLLLLFLVATFYIAVGERRLLQKLDQEMRPLWIRLPELSRPRFFSLLAIVVSALAPLVLLGFFRLIGGFIRHPVAWFELVQKLLMLWAAGALVLTALQEVLMNGLLTFCPWRGRRLYGVLRRVLLYITAGLASVWLADALRLPKDVLAFLRFAVSISVVCVLSSLFLKKDTLLSLLPNLSNRYYVIFMKLLDRAYYLLAAFTFFFGLLWCFGYRNLAAGFLIKTWGVGAAYVAIAASYEFLSRRLGDWSKKKEHLGDEAQVFFHAARDLFHYGTLALGALVILHLLGILAPLHAIVSTPLYAVGNARLSVWVFILASLIMLAFVYVSRLLRAYLDFAVYPSIGIETGLAYAMNTFIKYLMFAMGVLSALRAIGLNLQVLMVFAGAVGIGTGLGLQNMTANIISGFWIVFGRVIRKGDWIKAGDKLGMVTQISLRATKLWTRDNIEYLIPNTELISKTIVNYTLSSPLVRVYIPVASLTARGRRKSERSCRKRRKAIPWRFGSGSRK